MKKMSAIRNHITYRSETKQIETRNCDSAINLSDGSYAIILKIFYRPQTSQVIFEVEYIEVVSLVLQGFTENNCNFDTISLPHIFNCKRSGKIEYISGESIVDKCMYFNIKDHSYIVKRPNSFEMQ